VTLHVTIRMFGNVAPCHMYDVPCHNRRSTQKKRNCKERANVQIHIGMGNAKCNSHTNQYGTRYAGDAMRYGTGLAWHATCRRGTIRVYGLGAPLVYGVLVRTSFFPP